MRIEKIKNLIIKNYNLPPHQRTPVFIWGPPGVGKSSAVHQAADELNVNIIDLRMRLLSPIDLRGLPKIYNGKAIWSRPEFIPVEGQGILFLDDLPTAPPSVQASAYQLVLDRAVGSHRLGDGWYIVAAGNRETDAAATYRMPTPLKSRFLHIHFEVNVEDWMKWAISNNIHSAVTGFISYRNDLLLRFDPKTKETNYPCPRTWEFVSRELMIGDNDYESIAGCIGEGTAAEFLHFTKIREKMPDVDAILSGELKTLPIYEDSEKLGICHATISSLVAKISNMRLKIPAIDNALGFIMENMEPELNIAFITRLKVVAGSELQRAKMFSVFVKKYREVVF